MNMYNVMIGLGFEGLLNFNTSALEAPKENLAFLEYDWDPQCEQDFHSL